jgi:PAS domain S-box-containing protein
MFGNNADSSARVAALDRSQAVIEFKPDGTIITANKNFLDALGYTLDEIEGKHHSMFVDPAYRETADYRKFWSELAAGQFQQAEYKRIGKGGKEIWIQASYNPLIDRSGKTFKVVKYATDVTAAKLKAADVAGQIRRRRSSSISTAPSSPPTRIFSPPSDTACRKSRAVTTACSSIRRRRPTPPMQRSGPRSGVANSRPRNTCGTVKAARRSGFRRPTIRSST